MTKTRVKSIIVIAITILLTLGTFFGVYGVINKTKTKKITASAFSVGSISPETGEVESSDTMFCTKEMFLFTGLKIVPEFDSGVTYSVFYYDENANFIGSTVMTNSVYDYKIKKVPSSYKYCRILVQNVKSEQATIFNKNSILNDLNITINKEQDDYKLLAIKSISLELNGEQILTYEYSDDLKFEFPVGVHITKIIVTFNSDIKTGDFTNEQNIINSISFNHDNYFKGKVDGDSIVYKRLSGDIELISNSQYNQFTANFNNICDLENRYFNPTGEPKLIIKYIKAI